jgi:hypothetical protein
VEQESQSPYRLIMQQLAEAWKKDHPNHATHDLLGFWDFRGGWVEEAFGDLVPPQFVDQVEVDGQPWVMVFADDKLHLARVNDSLEVVFVGALIGGDYKESIGDQLRMEFSHPRLEELKITMPLEFEGSRGSREWLAELRALLRRWAGAERRA